MISDINCLSELISCGVALIPTRKDKIPFEPFKGKKRLGIVELVDSIRNNGAEYIAIRVGEISGGDIGGKRGLICLDIDSKHKEGFSEVFLLDVRTLYPEVFEKLLVDRTPSGGLHLYYIVSVSSDSFPSNCDLASRKSTDEELLVDPSRKHRCFLEFKASDGSLTHCYPSVGYSRLYGKGVTEISESEHGCLVSLCIAYNEVEKVEPFKIRSLEKSNYEDGQTPFDQFNLSADGAKVLDELGWRFYKTSGIYDKYIKPGNKGNNIGATFNRETKIYKIFTSASSIDQRCYNPSSLCCKYLFNGDWGSLYSSLVSRGYGSLKSSIEKSVIKRAIRDGLELPKNISEKGVEVYKDGVEKRKGSYPYGVFWEEVDEEEFRISREMLYSVSRELGFRIYKDRLCLIDGFCVRLVSERDYFDRLKLYIGDVVGELKDCYEAFLQNSGKFTISRLDVLDETLILTSTKSVSYKFFRNCYICIDSEDVYVLSYSELTKLVWFHDIKNRDFSLESGLKDGLYYEFIKNSIGWNEYVMKCIGYYAHDYRDEEGYLVIASEKCEHSKDGGGSGKNIFWSLFKLITTFKSTAASMIKKDTQFLQSWNYERIFVMADLPKNFDLIFFKDMVTDGAVVKKLYKDEFNVDVHEMAKLGASTNYSFDNSDPGLKRRVRVLEFSDYYTKRGGVKNVTGKMFPKDWDEREYLLFDNIMIACIQQYLISDCIIEEKEMSDGGFIKQFEQKYNHLYSFIKNYIEEWELLGKVSNSKFNQDYSEYLLENNIKKGMTAFTINKAIEDYCIGYKKKVKLDSVWRDNGRLIRGRYFGDAVKEEVKEDLPF